MGFVNPEFYNPEFLKGLDSPINSSAFTTPIFDTSKFFEHSQTPSSPAPTPATTPKQEDPEERKRLDAARAEALRLSTARLANSNAQTEKDSGLRMSGGNVTQSGNLTLAYPTVVQETKTTAGSGGSGLGSALGTIAGIGASFIPGLGPGIKAALPAIGGNIGSMFG